MEPRSLDLVDRLVWHHDGPFGDSSAVPTYLLSELTRKQVTVVLNGDGGDDVFGGYLRFYGGALSEEIPAGRSAALAASWASARAPRSAPPAAVRKRFAEAGRLPLSERYLRWTGCFTEGLPDLLRPELVPHAERSGSWKARDVGWAGRAARSAASCSSTSTPICSTTSM